MKNKLYSSLCAIGATMLFLNQIAYSQNNCNLDFPGYFSVNWQNSAWEASYNSNGGNSCSCPNGSRHVTNAPGTDFMSNNNLGTVRPGATQSLRLGEWKALQYVSSLEYSALLDGSNNILLFSYALVGSTFNGNFSHSQFQYTAKVIRPDNSEATISYKTVNYHQLNFAARTGFSNNDHDNFDYNNTDTRFDYWRSVIIDASDVNDFPPGSEIRLSITVNDDLSSASSDNKERFMYAYLDVQCMGNGNGGGEVIPPLQLCSVNAHTFTHSLASNTSDQITHEWLFGDGSPGSTIGNHAFPPSQKDQNGNYIPYHVELKLTMPSGDGSNSTYTIPIRDVIVIPTLTGTITHNDECGKFNEFVFSHPATSSLGESWVWDFGDGSPTSTEASPHHIYGAIGDFQMTLTFTDGEVCNRTFYDQVNVHNCPLECEDCITDFTLTPGDYVVSAWVKQETLTNNETAYTETSIRILIPGQANQVIFPSGPIIDGWQRMEGVFEVEEEVGMTIKLDVEEGVCYFDDIRIFPFDGSMMSYVYDPVTLRLMAELDERNYAKLYEYDEEGKLIRVKKETENGIMTIQENIENSAKQ